ncbi:MFS transporter [Streptococcus chenjunshii]|uniref:MFS transporter n=1 Tax=Streptococcus chenjunshii TaxID=2173853 RepID=A0A372KNZ7_9STRE|nr:MFS transporter [Streptococcus chenjunshii]AXQ78067.1 MFS transporter [Streptococcus chenjunshii]RFU51162.1 MFS transporter [Streptococcus chenjunshii]RFU53298.1 MFS transporter [Streptococcus chenjunshii]
MSQKTLSGKLISAILATGLLSFGGVLVETAMNITFPILMKEFAIGTATVQWMTTVYLLVVAIIVPLSAYLKRSFKMKQLFLTANLLFLIGLLIDIAAPNFTLLLLGRVVQGAGVGIALPLMFNIILEQVPMSKIGLMMGVGTLITAVAPAIGPTFGGLVAASLGWRYIFVLLVPLLLLSLFLGVRSIEQKSEVALEKFDLLSFLAIMALFVGLILGIEGLSSHPFFSFNVLGSLVLGVLGLVFLLSRSKRLEQPIVNLTILKNPVFAGHVAAFFLFQIVNLGLSFLIPNYVQLVNGADATAAGLIVLPGALLGACFSPFGGTILDRFGARKPIWLGAGLVLAALIIYAAFGLHLSNTAICLIYFLNMVGTGMAFGNIMTNGQKQLTFQERSDANAVFNTLQQFAGALGTTIAALIVAMSQVGSALTYSRATALGSRHAFILFMLLAGLQLLILVFVVKKDD